MSTEPMTYPLWPDGTVPGAQGVAPHDTPLLTIYPASNRPESAGPAPLVLVCPGGGYGGLAPHEAEPVARWANSHGATGIVLTYRLGPRYAHPIMLGDVQRALRTVRAHASEWNIDPARVALLGFSAGGHLASSGATHFDAGDPNAADPVERESCRPDAAILIYPVITMRDPFTHTGSRRNLLGESPDPALIDLMSNDEQVTAETPPTFLVHSTDDKAVPIENSLKFALALSQHGVPFAMQVYEGGGHGYGMGRADDPTTCAWPDQCAHWLRARGLFDATDLASTNASI